MVRRARRRLHKCLCRHALCLRFVLVRSFAAFESGDDAAQFCLGAGDVPAGPYAVVVGAEDEHCVLCGTARVRSLQFVSPMEVEVLFVGAAAHAMGTNCAPERVSRQRFEDLAKNVCLPRFSSCCSFFPLEHRDAAWAALRAFFFL